MAISPRKFSTSNLDAFLAACVCEGDDLSVISVLARLDLDPLEEARTLKKMRHPAAAHRLSSLLVRSDGARLSEDGAQDAAARLISLLHCEEARAATKEQSLAGGRASIPKTLLFLVVYMLISLSFVSLRTAYEGAGPLARSVFAGADMRHQALAPRTVALP